MASSRPSTDRALYVLVAVLSLLPVALAIVKGEILVFRDHFDYFLPLREFTASSLLSDDIPFWNPYNGSGERWLANPQSGIFYPPTWLFLALPLSLASNLFLAFHVALLGCGAVKLFRRFASREASLLAAIALILSGPTLSLLDVSNNLCSFAWLPLVVYAALAPARPARDAVLLALMFLGGEPFFAACGALIYASIVLISRAPRSVPRVAQTAALCVLLVLPQLVPFLGLLYESDRTAGLAADLALRNSVSIREWLWLLIPGTEGERSQGFIPLMFLPMVTILGSVASLRVPASREKKVFLSVALFAAAIATLPSIAIVAKLLAAGAFTFARYPARFVPFVVFGLSGLAAMALDEFHSSRVLRKYAAVAVLLLSASLIAVGPLSGTTAILFVANVIVALLFVFLPRAAAYSAALSVIPILAFLAAGPLIISSSPEMLRTPYAASIGADGKIARVLTDSSSSSWSLLRRARMMTGYRNLVERKFDLSSPAPVIDRRYLELHDAAVSPRLDLLAITGVRYVISERPLRVPNFVELRSGNPFVYQYRGALAPAYVASRSRGSRRGGARVDASFVSLSEVEIDVTLPDEAVVVLNQNDAPGWSVTIDGARAKKERAQVLFRAVTVPAGVHRIVWSYREPFFGVSLLAALVTISLLVAAAARAAGKGRD